MNVTGGRDQDRRSFRKDGSGGPHGRAIDLLDRLLSTEITIREFFRHADDLDDHELEFLSRMLQEQYWQVKAKQP